MPNRSTHQPMRNAFVIQLAVLALLPGLFQPVFAQSGDDATPVTSAIDLATVPLPPDLLPEAGFQLAQAGDLELGAVQYAWAGDGLEEDEWQPFEDGFRQAYSMVHVLLSDRADPLSEPIAQVLTTVVVLDSAHTAELARDASLDIFNIDGTQEIDEVFVYEDQQGMIGLGIAGDALVVVQYSFSAQQFSTQQDTDWTPDALAGLVNETGARLDDAVAEAEDGIASLGVANLMFHGPDAAWSISWPWFPNTEHYRVRDGEVVPYGGELDRDLRDAMPEGIDDLFVSRQQVGDDQYAHMVDVTLASFETEEDAAAFAADPLPVTFPPTWDFEVTYGADEEIDDDTRLERARSEGESLRATGYRTIRQAGTTVQVVQWLASEKAQATEDGTLAITAMQSACLDALPEPCDPVSQDEFPGPFDADSANQGVPADEATPAADGVIASAQYGWSVLPPDDGWQVSAVELDTGTEYYQLQSGRSLLTLESARDRQRDPKQCVLDNLTLLRQLEDRAEITLGSDDPDERTAGSEQNHAWAIYTVEPLQDERSDQEYTIRIDCYTLVPGEASLVVTHTAPREMWAEERDKGERFRDAIVIPPPTEIARITPPAGDRWDTGRTQHMGIPRIWMHRAA